LSALAVIKIKLTAFSVVHYTASMIRCCCLELDDAFNSNIVLLLICSWQMQVVVSLCGRVDSISIHLKQWCTSLYITPTCLSGYSNCEINKAVPSYGIHALNLIKMKLW